jgi:O-antigen/teichoic acid export membrane protein
MFDYFAAPDATVLVGRVYLRLVLVNLCLASGICMFGQEVIRLMASVEFQTAFTFLPPLAIGAVITNAAALFDAPVWISRKTYWKPVTMVFACGALVGGCIVFVPRLGAMGAALALLGGYIVQALASLAVSQRLLRVKVCWRELGMGSVIAAMLVFLAFMLHGEPTATVVKLLLWLSWLPLLWLTGVLDGEEKQWLARNAKSLVSVLCRTRTAAPENA